MKTYFNILAIVLFVMTSCVKMEEVHKDFISGGEIIYRAKPMDVLGYSGLNRAKLKWKLVCPSQVIKCEIWEKGKLLAEVPVEYQDTVRLEWILPDLEEKAHTFEIYSFDKDGNSSIKSEVIVEVYGEKYLNLLVTNTSLESVSRDAENESVALVKISERSSDKVVGTNLFYKNTAGEEKCVMLDVKTTSIELKDVAVDSYFKLQDLYKPNVNCIDNLPAPIREYAADDLP